jgi:hypothetical protein
MSKANGSGGTDDQNASGENQDNDNKETKETKDSVSFESHKKLLAEKKKVQSDKEALEKKLADLETEKLQTSGKKDEAIEALKKENLKLQSQITDIFGNFATKTVKQTLEAEAAKMGCLDPAVLMKIADLDGLEVNKEDFSVDSEQVQKVLGEVATKHPYLFKAGGPKFNDGLPKNKKEQKVEITSAMKEEDILAEWKRLGV